MANRKASETPAAKYSSINNSSSQPSKMMIGMSPRLQSLQNGDSNGPHDNEHMNSSCKDTMKMNGAPREFSFFESVNREFCNANAGFYRENLGHSR